MKRATAAAVTVATAVVLAGGSAGVAMAYDHHPSHPGRTPTVTVQVNTTHPAATSAPVTARHTAQSQRQQVIVHRTGQAKPYVASHRTATQARTAMQQQPRESGWGCCDSSAGYGTSAYHGCRHGR